jgi:transposase
MKRRGNFNSTLKAKIACAALRENKSMNELSSEHGVHVTQISKWRKIVLTQSPELFEHKRSNNKGAAVDVAELQRLVGEQTIQLAWYKKKLGVVS